MPIEKLPGGKASLEKAYYRRGICYLRIGEIEKSKQDLLKANEIAEGKNALVLQGLKELKDKIQANKQKEREVS